MTFNITQDEWDKLSHEEKHLHIQRNGDLIRGAIINAFTALEWSLINFTVIIKYDGVFTDYMTGWGKPSKEIIKDFIGCYDTLMPNIENCFVSRELLQTDLEYLASIRNRAAHFAHGTDDYNVQVFDGANYYFLAARKGQEEVCSFQPRTVADFQQAVGEFLKRLAYLDRTALPQHLKRPQPRTMADLIPSCVPIIIKPVFESLKGG